MRDILFRGKRVDNGEWVEGHYHYGHWYLPPSMKIVDTTYYIKPIGYGDSFKVDPSTVGQFTGLTDKNGKKIFEGDIVKTVAFGFNMCKFITEVKFGPRCGVQGFYLANGRSMFYFGQKNITVMDDTEIIGNIHDTPELTKGE